MNCCLRIALGTHIRIGWLPHISRVHPPFFFYRSCVLSQIASCLLLGPLPTYLPTPLVRFCCFRTFLSNFFMCCCGLFVLGRGKTNTYKTLSLFLILVSSPLSLYSYAYVSVLFFFPIKLFRFTDFVFIVIVCFSFCHGYLS